MAFSFPSLSHVSSSVYIAHVELDHHSARYSNSATKIIEKHGLDTNMSSSKHVTTAASNTATVQHMLVTVKACKTKCGNRNLLTAPYSINTVVHTLIVQLDIKRFKSQP